jgi:DNA-binding MurR/RpiR family transcriptional regulator
MSAAISLGERINARLAAMSPAEQRVAGFFTRNREQVLIASASALAAQAGVSDATVIRTTRALGYAGMDDLRRALAAELREDLTPVGRLARTLGEVGDDLQAAFDISLDIHQEALEHLRRNLPRQHFTRAVEYIVAARRVAIFGIGPSSAVASYFSIQLGRFGVESLSLTNTGLLLADDAHKLRTGDLLIAFAYSRVYRELAVLLRQANRHDLRTILVTDTLAGSLSGRVDLVLEVARGRADMLSMHTATVGLIEALLVGIATVRPERTMSNLRALNELRAELAGASMNLPASAEDG